MMGVWKGNRFMKRLIVLLLSLTLLLSCIPVQLSAEGGQGVEMKLSGITSAQRGQELEVKVDVIRNTGFAGMKLHIDYDESVLELTDIVDNGLFAIEPIHNVKKSLLNWLGFVSKDFTNTGSAVTLKFRVKDSAPFISSNIGISAQKVTDVVNIEAKVVDFKCDVIALEVVCKHPKAAATAEKKASCEDDGNIEYWTCPDCGNSYSDSSYTKLADVSKYTEEGGVKIKALGHDFVNHAEVESSCTETGMYEYYTCSRCDCLFDKDKNEVDKAYDFTMPKKDHKITHHDRVDATCTSTGTVEYWGCEFCGEKYSDEGLTAQISTIEIPVDPTNHDGHLGTLIAEVPATCTNTGTKEHYHCSECGKDFSDAQGKNVIADLVIAIDPANHINGLEHTEHTAPTCSTGEILEHWHCGDCNKNFDADGNVLEKVELDDARDYTNHSSALEHIEAKTPNCKETGNVEYYHCPDCGRNFADSEGKTDAIAKVELDIDAKNHANGLVHKDGTAPTCSTGETLEHWHCDDCGKNYAASDANGQGEPLANVELDDARNPDNHSDLREIPASPATCTQNGNTQHWYCSGCNKYYAEAEAVNQISQASTVIKATGHNFVNDTCTICGMRVEGNTPMGYIYVDDHYHGFVTSNGLQRLSAHMPSSIIPATDGEYEWHICAVCGAEFARTPVVTVNDVEDIIVEDPAESTGSETDDKTGENIEIVDTQPDTNPSTGIVISMILPIYAAVAVMVSKKK